MSENKDRVGLPDLLTLSLREHGDRVCMLIRLAGTTTSETERHRLLVLALYPARAIVEQLETRQESNHGKEAARSLRQDLARRIPHFKLVEYARNHDFHRYALLPPIQGMNMVVMSGPYKMVARQGGIAGMSGTGPELKEFTTRNSTVSADRPIQLKNGWIFDDASGQWIDLLEVLQAYMAGLEPLILEQQSQV